MNNSETTFSYTLTLSIIALVDVLINLVKIIMLSSVVNLKIFVYKYFTDVLFEAPRARKSCHFASDFSQFQSIFFSFEFSLMFFFFLLAEKYSQKTVNAMSEKKISETRKKK